MHVLKHFTAYWVVSARLSTLPKRIEDIANSFLACRVAMVRAIRAVEVLVDVNF
jgi:hypothetical protein